MRHPRPLCAALLATLAATLLAPTARATTLDYLRVGDPVEAELRVLDLLGPPSAGLRLRHLHTRPLSIDELLETLPDSMSADIVRQYSETRALRQLGREWPERAWPGSTPRLVQLAPAAESRFEISAGVEAAGVADEHDSHYVSGSGAHVRTALQVERWLAYSHVTFGEFEGSRAYADPIVANTDVTTLTDETYLAYASGSGRWSAMFGRNRWHWGPGDEGSLILSKTSAAYTGLSLRASVPEYRLDFAILNATLQGSAGEQLAAHRVEWQATNGLRLGLTETARYHADGWSPLYAVGIIPYVLVQRLEAQDEPDSGQALRNNVMVSGDLAWRIAPGTRVYGELLIDDLHAKSAANPNKLAYQLGLEGVGAIGTTRVTWGLEYTRLSRYVYTSFFGESFEAQGAPLGFPTGPDSERLRVRAALDFGPDWQVLAGAALTNQGELGIHDPFVPGSSYGPAFKLSGVVEQSRAVEAGLRWWPASGVDLAATVGWRWIDNQGHVDGASDSGAEARFALRLMR